MTSLAGGVAATAIATRMGGKEAKTFKRAGLAGLAGSVGGVVVGNLINNEIAKANRPQLPTIGEYQNMNTDRI